MKSLAEMTDFEVREYYRRSAEDQIATNRGEKITKSGEVFVTVRGAVGEGEIFEVVSDTPGSIVIQMLAQGIATVNEALGPRHKE